MGTLKNFENALSRNEMRNVIAGSIKYFDSGFHSCGNDCRVQSPAKLCQNGKPPECRPTFCSNQWGTSTDWSFSCGTS
ncbi:hypothetical protein [Flavobacterium sp.]|jgi:hypothetical protein|uniref:hypothetical protein n=1 Tax=Flavobacterium sp. TaxID=239 RepID=UPI0037C0DCCC